MKYIIIYFLNIFDYICTRYQVDRYGIEVEANPLMRWLMQDPHIFLSIKVTLVNILLLFIYDHREERVAEIGTWLLLIVYGALALYHIFLLLI